LALERGSADLASAEPIGLMLALLPCGTASSRLGTATLPEDRKSYEALLLSLEGIEVHLWSIKLAKPEPAGPSELTAMQGAAAAGEAVGGAGGVGGMGLAAATS